VRDRLRIYLARVALRKQLIRSGYEVRGARARCHPVWLLALRNPEVSPKANPSDASKLGFGLRRSPPA
jgi:hypothetical protein